MHSVLFKLQQQAEVYKEMEKMRMEWLYRKMQVLDNQPIKQRVFKRLGLWNMRDEDFYADNRIFENVLVVTNMMLLFGLFNVKYHKKLDPETCNVYNGIDEIPIVCINANEYAFELKAPFTKEFFENLIGNECNILEFGSQYAFVCNAKNYGTYKLFSLFFNQDFKSPLLCK